MQNYIKQGKLSIFLLLFTVSGIFFASCDDDITIGEVDQTPYVTANETQGYLKSSTTSRNSIPVEVRGTTDLNVYFGLTKAMDNQVDVSIGIDESLVAAYNKENFTSYEVFPATQVNIGNGGKLSVEKWKTESNQLTISLSKGNLEEATYLLPITVKENANIEVAAASKTIYYFVKVAGKIPSTEKPGGIKTLCYVEVNDNNILNVGSYTLEDSGIPFFDIAVVFAANIRYDATTGEVYLKYNDNVTHLLNNRDKYIKPLQDKGIKVILGLLGDHDFVGLGNLKGESLRNFAKQCKIAVDTYGLDGVDFDDEWSNYPTSTNATSQWYPEWAASGTKMARLIIETRRLMPDKIITVFEYNQGSSIPNMVDGIKMTDIIDHSMYAMYSNSSMIRSSNIGMPKEKFSPTAVNVTQGNGSSFMSSANLGTVSTRIKDQGYGLIFFYDLRAADMSEHFSYASNALYGENVVFSQSYGKDW